MPEKAEREIKKRGGAVRYRTLKQGDKTMTCAVTKRAGPQGGKTVCWAKESVKSKIDRLFEEREDVTDYSAYEEPRLSPNQIQQTNDMVRRAIVPVRIDRNPDTMNDLYAALQRRRQARSMKSKPVDGSWLKLGL
jgi:hypothetical protein